MRRILVLVLFCSLAAVPIGIGSPTDGSSATGIKLKPADVVRETKTFRAGERACVMVVGNLDSPVVNLEISVFDHKNVLVASDQTSGASVGDFACVIWYPPRDGEYRIEVRNPGTSLKSSWIAIK